MSLPAATLPWNKLARFALRTAAEGFGIYEAYLDSEHVESGPTVGEWRQLQVSFSRTAPSGATEDRAIITLDVLNVTDGDWDSSWITADYTTAETALNTWWTALKPNVAASHTLKEYRWFRRAFVSPMDTHHRFVASGPPERITSVNTAGTGSVASGCVPYQAAYSVTERTSIPKHWGRMYVPGVTAGAVLANSRFDPSIVDSIATAFRTLYNTLATADLIPVVAVTQVDGALGGRILPVMSIQVDDVPDVIRSRRPKQTTYRKLITVG